MTSENFQIQMKRLRTQFGEAAYSTERAALIWREVKDLSDAWFVRATDEFIGGHRFPPLLPEIREATAKERERVYEFQKRQHTRQAEEFIENVPRYTSKDFRIMSELIRQIARGNLPDEEVSDIISGKYSSCGSA